MRVFAFVVAVTLGALALGAVRPCAPAPPIVSSVDHAIDRADALADAGDIVGSTEWLARAERIMAR